jgi:ribosome-associated protein
VVFLRHMAARKLTRPPARAALVRTVVDALEDMKAVNVKVLDVRAVTDVSDCMVLASGNSDRHVRSIADRVVQRAKEAGCRPLGVEGERDGEWVLVDLNDVLVHVMLPRVREFYALEELWETPATRMDVPRVAAGGRTRGKAAAKAGRPAGAAKSAAAKKGGATRKPAAPARAGAARARAAKKKAARRGAGPRA